MIAIDKISGTTIQMRKEKLQKASPTIFQLYREYIATPNSHVLYHLADQCFSVRADSMNILANVNLYFA